MIKQAIFYLMLLLGITIINVSILAGFFTSMKSTSAYLPPHTVPKYFLKKQIPQWTKIKYDIMRGKDKTMYYYWEGNGGLVSEGDSFIRAVKKGEKQGKKIRFIVTGAAISTHAHVLCYVKNVEFTKNSVLIFHAFFNRDTFTHKKYYSSARKIYNYLLPCVKKGYLTKSEIRKIAYNHLRINVYPNGTKKYLPDWAVHLTDKCDVLYWKLQIQFLSPTQSNLCI